MGVCFGSVRNDFDFYQTPYALTRLLLTRISPVGSILEPACGKGAIVKVLREYGIDPVYYDRERDFFTEERRFDWVITNPPFFLSIEFIEKAKEVADNIAFLLPLDYLSGLKRWNRIWSDGSYRLKKVITFNRKPMFGETIREDGTFGSGGIAFAWFIFEKGYQEIMGLEILNVNRYYRAA